MFQSRETGGSRRLPGFNNDQKQLDVNNVKRYSGPTNADPNANLFHLAITFSGLQNQDDWPGW